MIQIRHRFVNMILVALFFLPVFIWAANECESVDHTGSVSSTNPIYTNSDKVYWIGTGIWNRKRYYITVESAGHVDVTITNDNGGDVRFNASTDSCPDYYNAGTSWSYDFSGPGDFNIDVTAWIMKSYYQRYTLTIQFTPTTSPTPPTISDIPDQTAIVGQSFNLDLSTYTTEPNGDDLNYSTSDLPDGLSVDRVTGIISGTPTTVGTYTVTATATDKDGSSSTTFKINVLEVVDNADDLCYEEKELDGWMCFDMGICGGGIGCKNIYPIKNIGDNNLSNVQVIFNEDSWSGSFFGSCGVEPENAGECRREDNIDFGPFGIFGQSTVYDFYNPIPPSDNSNKFWFENFMSGWCFPSSDIYGSYIKDGKLHRGRLKPCGPIGGFRDFSLRKQIVDYGNMVTIGNTILVVPKNTTNCDHYRDGPYYSDTTQSNANYTLCPYYADKEHPSTSAEAVEGEGTNQIPPKSHLLWAGLYWQSIVKNEDLGSIRSQVIHIRNGNDPYEEVHYTALDYKADAGKEGYTSYSAFADVTQILKDHGWLTGTFTVADIPTETHNIPSLGQYGAWTLVLVYGNPQEKMRAFSIFDGWKKIEGFADPEDAEVDIEIEGFYTPKRYPIRSAVSVFTAEGDKRISGDYLEIQNANEGDRFDKLTYTTGQTFDSSIHPDIPRAPDPVNNQGIDIQTFEVGGDSAAQSKLTTGQTSVTFKFTTKTYGDDRDTYFPSMIAFNTEVYTPNICYDYTYGQYGHYRVAPDTAIPTIEGIFDPTAPIDVKLFFKNREASDISLSNLDVNIHDINVTQVSYKPDSTAIKKFGGGYEKIPDDNRDVGPDRDMNISIGSLGSEEYFYTYYSLDINQSYAAKAGGSIDTPIDAYLSYDLSIQIGDKTIYLGHQRSPINEMEICASNTYYSVSPGRFNVVYNPPSGNSYLNNLPTQVVDREQDHTLLSLNPDRLDNLKSVSTMVAVEMLDASGYHYTDATCLDPNATIASDGKIWVLLDQSSSELLSRDLLHTKRFFGKALQNGAFRIIYDTNGTNGDLIRLEKKNGKYRIANYPGHCDEDCKSNHWMSAEKLPTCMECLKRFGSETLCSRDNFAIRPESYRITVRDRNQSTEGTATVQAVADNSATDRITAAARYNYLLEINATGHQGDNAVPGYYSVSYTATEKSPSIVLRWKGTDASKCADASDHNLTALRFPWSGSLQTSEFRLPNAGPYDLHIEDSNWTRVDWDPALMPHHLGNNYWNDPDTPDCIEESHIVPARSDHSFAAIGCLTSSDQHHNEDLNLDYYDQALDARPDHFDLSSVALHTRPHDGIDWIYMSDLENDKRMAVTLEGNLSAMGADGTILGNYTEECEARDIHLYADTNSTPSPVVDSAGTEVPLMLTAQSYDNSFSPLQRADENLTFSKAEFQAGDRNGTAQVALYLNLQKNDDTLVNVSEINFTTLHAYGINDLSHSGLRPDRMPEGNRTIGEPIRFYYAKVSPDRDPETHSHHYRIVNGSEWAAPLKVRTYCRDDASLVPPLVCANLTEFDPLSKEADPTLDGFWYLMQVHDSDAGDGQVNELDQTAGTQATIDPHQDITFSQGISVPIVALYPLANPRPYTVRFRIVADPWLRYAPDENVTIYFDKERLRWKGKGKTGHVIQTEPNTARSQRINW